jgi:DNA-binding response OmpR family regulator
MKLLIIEDEKFLSESISDFLKKEGFICEIAMTYDEASEKINLYHYDCVIVDLTLPDGNGLNIIKELKNYGYHTGIIIISARSALDDKIKGLDLGADDYLTKPFHLSELNARIKSVIRRKSFDGKKEIVINEIRIIPDLAEVFVNNQPIVLTRKEYEMLMFFIANKDRILTKESLAEHLWGDEMDMEDSHDFIYSHIKNLRKKILEKTTTDYIKNIYGMGYKFASV